LRLLEDAEHLLESDRQSEVVTTHTLLPQTRR
jgi:hypothetical protein